MAGVGSSQKPWSQTSRSLMELPLYLSLRPRQEIVVIRWDSLLEYAQVLSVPIIPSFSILIQVNVPARAFSSWAWAALLPWRITIQIEEGFVCLQPRVIPSCSSHWSPHLISLICSCSTSRHHWRCVVKVVASWVAVVDADVLDVFKVFILSAKGISIFISALTSQLIDQVVHLHCFDVPPETFRSDVDSMRVTQCAAYVPAISGAGVVHEVLSESPWHEHVIIFSPALEPSSTAVSVQLEHPWDGEVPVDRSLRLHLSLVDLAGARHSTKRLTVLVLARNVVVAASIPLNGGVQEGGSCLIALTSIATCCITAVVEFVFQDVDVLKVEFVLNVVNIASVVSSKEINDLTIAEIASTSLGIAMLGLAFFWFWLLILSFSFGTHRSRRPWLRLVVGWRGWVFVELDASKWASEPRCPISKASVLASICSRQLPSSLSIPVWLILLTD